MVEAASSTRAAFNVAMSGRWLPVASANPATVPGGSATAVMVTAETTPEVPMETTTSPGRAARPSAAAALSPVPGPSTADVPARTPTASAGPATRGTAGRRPRRASSSRSYRYSPVRADQYAVPLASPRSVASVAGPGAGETPQVSQSGGRQTAAVRSALAGSASASQRSLAAVKDATGTTFTASAHACRPPSS